MVIHGINGHGCWLKKSPKYHIYIYDLNRPFGLNNQVIFRDFQLWLTYDLVI